MLTQTDDHILIDEEHSATALSILQRHEGCPTELWHQMHGPLISAVNTVLADLKTSRVVVPIFEVEVAEYVESTGTTYMVVMRNLSLPHSMRDDNPTGLITPYQFASRDRAVHEAADMSRFLGIPVREHCHCIMCEDIK